MMNTVGAILNFVVWKIIGKYFFNKKEQQRTISLGKFRTDDDCIDFPFERDFWGRKNPLYVENAKNLMKTDIREHDEGYELDIDLPGFKKDEITFDLDNGYLTISAAEKLLCRRCGNRGRRES